MQRRTDLEELDLIVRRRSGRYLAKIPQIGLYATADSLPKAIESLEDKKKVLLDELTAADALNEIPISPSRSAAEMRMLPVLALFAAKAVIVLALVLFAGGLARFIVQRDFERNMDRLERNVDQLMDELRLGGGARFWANVEKNIERAADPASEIPAARKQALIANLHVIVDRWRPFVREAGRLFSDQGVAQPGNP
jgi:hypothetical protein